MIKIDPVVKAPYDPNFAPMELIARAYQKAVAYAESQMVAVAVVRNQGYTSTLRMKIFKDGTNDELNNCVMDRIVKTLLWARGDRKSVV